MTCFIDNHGRPALSEHKQKRGRFGEAGQKRGRRRKWEERREGSHKQDAGHSAKIKRPQMPD